MLTEAQNHSGLLPVYMVDFLSHSAKNFNELIPQLKDNFEKYRGSFQGKSHLRIPEMLAWIQVGFDLGMANLSRHIGEEYLATFKTKSRDVLTMLGEQQSTVQNEERYSQKFLQNLWTLLGQNRVFLLSSKQQRLECYRLVRLEIPLSATRGFV